jgi:hypothetical protein
VGEWLPCEEIELLIQTNTMLCVAATPRTLLGQDGEHLLLRPPPRLSGPHEPLGPPGGSLGFVKTSSCG